MKRPIAMAKALFVGASLLSLVLPIDALAGSISVVSDTNWEVWRTDANGVEKFVGVSQIVCLTSTNPSNCPPLGGPTPAPTIYGYTPSPAWTANFSAFPDARWMWAPNITGESSPAASQEFTFKKDVYICDPPRDGTISIAADNFAEVSVNGSALPTTSADPNSVTTFSVPASLLHGASILNTQPNHISIKARNGPNPSDCVSDQYKCNPAGVVIGATLNWNGDPTCTGFKDGKAYHNGEFEQLSACMGNQTGPGLVHVCVCGAWLPDMNECQTPPPQCTDKDNNGAVKTFNVGMSEPIDCPSTSPSGSASRTCVANDQWGPPDYSKCVKTCTDKDSAGNIKTFNIGDIEQPIACPSGLTGSASRTCNADGWGMPDNSQCHLPSACNGCICGSSTAGQTGTCPSGVECGPRKIGGPVPILSRSEGLMTSDWYCGLDWNYPLGDHCRGNTDCASGYCDIGWNTSQTGLCMPQPSAPFIAGRRTISAAGKTGDLCSDNAQCISGRCGGLHQDNTGAWQPGHCSDTASALGEYCTGDTDCASTYCDRGDGTSKTSLCMPRGGAGKTGDPCSNNNQCVSNLCSGLRQDNTGAWQPGRCSTTTSGLGQPCTNNSDCASTYCDRGDGTSKTSLCMPRGGAGKIGEPCSDNNQCASNRCGGLHQDNAGAWQPGRCSATTSALGEYCTGNSDCASAYCDRGDGTSKTSLCMPRGGAGKTGEPCSNNNQCSNHVCVGLQPLADGSWKPGKCN